MRSTYTYVLLDVSPEAYREIRAKLEAAGYDHAIDGQHIDMHGIALNCDAVFEMCWCGHAKADHQAVCSTYAARCNACFKEQQALVHQRRGGNFLNCYHDFEDAHARPSAQVHRDARADDARGRRGRADAYPPQAEQPAAERAVLIDLDALREAGR